MSAAKQPAQRPEFSPLSLARIFWKHYMMILVLAVLGSVGSFAIVHEIPAVYKSEAVILVDSQKIPERYVASTVNTEVQDRLATISQEILSTTRLQKIIDNFGLYREERKRLVQEEIIELMRKDISITLEKGWTRNQPGAFRVGYEGRNPTQVTEVANQLANLFIEENLRTRERQAQGTADFIDSQLKEAKQSLDELEAKVSKYKLEHNGDLPEQESALIGTLARLQIELQGNQDAINRAQQNKIMLQGTLDMSQAAAGALQQIQGGPRLQNAARDDNRGLQPQSAYLQAQYDALSQEYKSNYPKMVALRRDIEKQKMTEDAEKVRIENLKKQIVMADGEVQQQIAARAGIMKSIAEYQARVNQLPVREQEMAALTRDYEISKANYKSLLDKKLDAGMATDMERRQEAERFTMIDPPRVPEKPIKPKKPLLEGLGCAASLGLGLILAFGKESKKNALLGEWELAESVEVLGRVPFIDPAVHVAGSDRGRPARKWKWALVSSAVLSVLAIGAAGAYFYLGWR